MSLTLEKLNEDLAVLQQRKILALEGVHQIIGAISIVEQMIQRESEPKHDLIDNNCAVMDSSAGQEDGQINE